MATHESASVRSNQVLARIGNRYVVFGNPHGLGVKPAFGPSDVTNIGSRVGDESEWTEAQLLEGLRVSKGTIIQSSNRAFEPWDLKLITPEGQEILVEVKVRQRDLKPKDYEKLFKEWRSTTAPDKTHEVWNFNTEHLKLEIAHLGKGKEFPEIFDFQPLDVWSYGDKGESFNRSRVEASVKEWCERLEELYSRITSWVAAYENLRVSRDRSVTMAEELQQSFAVPSVSLDVLDILSGETNVTSFVPYARWIVGGRGRVNVITLKESYFLIDVGVEKQPSWMLVDPDDRSNSKSFDATVFGTLVPIQ